MQLVKQTLRRVYTFLSRYCTPLSIVFIWSLTMPYFLPFQLQKIVSAELLLGKIAHFAFLVLVIVLPLKVALIAVSISAKTRTLGWHNEPYQLNVKKRYADFLFNELITDIGQIQNKYLYNSKASENNALDYFVRAHDGINKKIESFRMNARKLFSPNEMELKQPIEAVYGFDKSRDKLVRNKRSINMSIVEISDAFRKIINP